MPTSPSFRAALAGVLILAASTPVAAETAKCRAAISAASAAYVQTRATVLQKCRERVLQRKLVVPGAGCTNEPKVAAAITKATAKLGTTIAKACGGKNKRCNAADTGVDADDTPASVGFGASCPNLEKGGCGSAIGDCNDVATCLACIDSVAVDQALGLSYDQLLPTDPTSKDLGERARHKCQVAIGKHASTLLRAQSKLLARCWKTVNKSGGMGTCPDSGTASAITAARAKLASALAKACGGGDATAGTADDVTPAAIGFPSTCLNTAVPVCAGTVATLPDLVACVDCIGRFKVDCTDAAAIPAFAPYPVKCNAGTKQPTIFTLNAVASGAYFSNLTHLTGNYAAGWYATGTPPNVETRNYFVFDSTGIPGTIIAAYLRLSTAPPGSTRYGSTDPSETFTLFAVTTPIATLTNGTGGAGAFADLADGATYGSVVATSSLGATVDVSVNGTGVAFLEANRGPIAIGGAITTLTKGAANEFLFNATSAALTRQLVVAAQ